jgi:hypothetical protein
MRILFPGKPCSGNRVPGGLRFLKRHKVKLFPVFSERILQKLNVVLLF